MTVSEILSRYPEEKPLTLNYATVREDIQALVADNGLLFDEVLNLARESVKRELKLAKLEAEVARWAQAEADGLLLALPCDIGDTVYWLSYFGGGILSGEVLVIKLSGFGIDLEILRGDVVIKREYEKTFLTRDAAEAALEGAGG